MTTGSKIPSVEQKLENLSINDNVASQMEAKVDPAKKVKALKKKLREIEEIEKKAIADLTPEQVEKLNRKASIEDEIKLLEA